MRLIVGLGNPGREYKNTRHNAGFMAVEAIGREFDFEDMGEKERFRAKLACGKIGAEQVLLLKPQTFMNLSGEAVSAVLHYYKITSKDLIVIYDDFTIAPGTVRIRPSGSAGGHNGMSSIIGTLKTEDFIRIRIGIAPLNAWQGATIPAKGRGRSRQGTHTDYVLGRLTPQEQEMMEAVFRKIPEIVRVIFQEGAEGAMQRFN